MESHSMPGSVSCDEDLLAAMGDACETKVDNHPNWVDLDEEKVSVPQKNKNFSTSAFSLTPPIMEKIWTYLDTQSRHAIATTCTFFYNEICKQENSNCVTERKLFHEKFFAVIYQMVTFMPISRYLNINSWMNLRMVCKEVKLIIDDSLPYIIHENISWNILPGELSISKSYRPETTIMDIKTNDLKRIFSYVLGHECLDSLKIPKTLKDRRSISQTCSTFARVISDLVVSPFEEFIESDDINILDLPVEVHKQLLKTCIKESLPILRGVCKLFKFEIDSFVGVNIYINDSRFMDKRGPIFYPPASRLIIDNLVHVEPLSILFMQHPAKFISRLVLKGAICKDVAIRLFEECHGLKSINLSERLKMPAIRYELFEPIFLNELKTLELNTVDEDGIVIESGWHFNTAFDLLSSDFIMPVITKLSLLDKNICPHILLYETANVVLLFFERHVETLKDIQLVLLGNCDRMCQCPAFRPAANLKKLMKLKLRKFSYDCNWKICHAFSRILMAQKSLEDMEIFKLCDWEFHEDVIRRNCLTLRSITIQKNLAPVIDLAVLGNCLNLEMLRICRNDEVNKFPDEVQFQLPAIVQSTDFDPRLRNFNKLPRSLKHLHILDQTVKSSDIEEVISRLTNLETLELQFLGGWRCYDMGVTLSSLKYILQLPKLRNMFIEEVFSLNTGNEYLVHFDETIRKVNMIPEEYVDEDFQWKFSCRNCFLFGLLISEKEPSNEFMPLWLSRYLKYFVEIFKSNPRKLNK